MIQIVSNKMIWWSDLSSDRLIHCEISKMQLFMSSYPIYVVLLGMETRGEAGHGSVTKVPHSSYALINNNLI